MLGVGGVLRATFVGVDVLGAETSNLLFPEFCRGLEFFLLRTVESWVSPWLFCPSSNALSSTKRASVMKGVVWDSALPGLGSSLGAGERSTVFAAGCMNEDLLSQRMLFSKK